MHQQRKHTLGQKDRDLTGKLFRRWGALPVCALLLFGSATSNAQKTKDLNALFVPDDFVPVSQFAKGVRNITINFSVHVDILQHPGQILVAELHGDEVIYEPPDIILDPGVGINGQVQYTPAHNSDGVVIVHGALRNRFDVAPGADTTAGVVTHWHGHWTTGPGKGEWKLGWTDGIVTRDFKVRDPNVSVIPKNYDFNTTDDGGIFGGTPGLTFNDKFALFNDQANSYPNSSLVGTPAHERYVAEDWSTVAVTQLAAIRTSDYARAMTGYPIAHRNYFRDDQTLLRQIATPPSGEEPLVDEDLPVFQMLHNYVVEFDSPDTPGTENALASFILPPSWRRLSDGNKHKVLFTSTYDIAATTNIQGAGGIFLKAIGDVYNKDSTHKVIGIVMNGGGTHASLGLHASAEDHVEQVWIQASEALSLSFTDIVVTGSSRSGSTALSIWSHPELGWEPTFDQLRAKYIIADAPNTHPAETLRFYGNPTYSLLQAGITHATGLSESFKQVLPVTGKQPFAQGADLALTNLIDPTYAELPLGSPARMNALTNRRTKIIYRARTHDYSKSFAHDLEYAKALRDQRVPFRFEVNYRFGHAAINNVKPNEGDVLEYLFNGRTFKTGTFFYRPDPDVASESIREQFFPARAPIIVEAPLRVEGGLAHTFTIAGPKDMGHWLRVFKVEGTPPVPVGPSYTLSLAYLTEGYLGLGGGIDMGYYSATFIAPNVTEEWSMELGYTLPSDPQNLLTLDGNNGETAIPSGYEEDLFPIIQYTNMDEILVIGNHGRTGGISDDLLVSPPK